MAASDPIASNIGHGALGLRSNLRQFSDFAIATSSAKQVFLEMRGSVLLSPPATWTLTSGTTYELLIAPGTFKGKTLDWVGVRTLQQAGGETLVRRESQAAVTATAGSWFYNRATTTIYVRLSTTTTDVNTFGVVGEVGFYYSNVGVTQPHFGTEKLVDGGMETWTSATNLTNWTEDISGAGNTVDREATDIQVGTYSCKLTSTGSAAGHASIYVSTTDTAADQIYAISGRYKTSPTQSANLLSQIIVTDGAVDSNVVQADGRTYLSGTYPVLTNTNGEWRHFSFYLLARTAATRLRFRQISGSAGAGYLLLDDVQWRPVFAWNQHEPRVQNLEQFTVRESRSDVYWGSWTVGVGNFSLLNDGPAPGHFEELIGRFNFVNAAVTIRIGGRFSDDGEEVVPTALHTMWLARVKRPEITDMVANFPVRDIRDKFLSTLPISKYEVGDFSGMDQRKVGAYRPIVFVSEDLDHINAVRTSSDGTTAFGIYEVADVSSAPNGVFSADVEGYAYTTEEAALNKDASQRIAISSASSHVSLGASTGLISVLVDLQVYVFDITRFCDFTRNGTAYVMTAVAGIYTPATLCAVLQSTGRTSSGSAALTVTYSTSTHLVTIADASAATLTLLTRTGVRVAGGAWEPIGFTQGGSDKTGSLSYAGDFVIFDTADAKHHLRFKIDGGYKDDASGTYTGSASSLIYTDPDVLRTLLVRWMNIDPTTIDATSFNALRASANGVNVYIGTLADDQAGEAITAREIFERLELGMQADLQLSGGVFYLRARSDSVPANVVDIFDNDILAGSFSSWIDDTDVFGTVAVHHSQDPSLGIWKTNTTGLSRVDLLYGRPETKNFYTFQKADSDAGLLKLDLSALAETPKRKFRMKVRGKLFTKTVADTFRLNRTRGITSSAGASPYTTPVLVRIIDITRSADLSTDIVAVAV